MARKRRAPPYTALLARQGLSHHVEKCPIETVYRYTNSIDTEFTSGEKSKYFENFGGFVAHLLKKIVE